MLLEYLQDYIKKKVKSYDLKILKFFTYVITL